MIDIKDVCSFIYQNPELGFEEFEAARMQKQFLEEHGFEV
jgi:metal-dependent amidase/aminoacylase/carboxypeptidase family protein